MLRRIKLYGALAKFIGKRVLQADVATPAEAVRFLLANWPELERHMADQHYKVALGKDELEIGDHPEQLHTPAGASEIRIIPVTAGAGAVGRILAGVALIALTIATGGFALAGAPAAIGLFGAGTISVASLAVGIGASLILGGVAQMLTPVPKPQSLGTDSEDDPRKSYSFSGIQNTARNGVPVPVVYGQTLVGSVTISQAVDVADL
jgi:predicted phage tail protein